MPKQSLLLIAHILGWVFFYSTIISFLSLAKNNTNIWVLVLSWKFAWFVLLFPVIFYSNLLYFTPRYFIPHRYAYYTGAFLLFLLLILQNQPFDQLMSAMPAPYRSLPPDSPNFREFPPPQKRGKIDIISLILFLFCWVLSTAIPIVKAWQLSEERARKAEQDKLQAELSFLKAQIHPHFLFNTLNNLYSMALSGHTALSGSILQLSNIMRYITDEVRNDYVQLEQEIECIRDYIDLQKLRVGKLTQIEFDTNNTTTGKKIAPLILMTFIENIFKYGISKQEPSTITIRIETDSSGIRFYCRNKLYEGTAHLESTGIGIENTKKRLTHLYPEKHLLNITENDGLYSVQLILLD